MKMKFPYFFIFIYLFVSIYSQANAGKLNLEDANLLFQNLATYQPDVECYEKNIFKSCIEVWNSRDGKNKHTLAQLHKITQTNPVLHELATFWKMNEFLGNNSIRQDTLNLLQVTYRKEAKIKGKAYYFLDSYRLRQNDSDMQSYISNSSNEEVYKALLNNSIKKDEHRKEALDKYYNSNNPHAITYAYKITNNDNDIVKILVYLKTLNQLNSFIVKHENLRTHTLVNDKYISFYRQEDTPQSLYKAYLLSSSDTDVETLLAKMTDIATIKQFISNKDKLTSHRLVNDKLANMFRKLDTFEDYIQAFHFSKQKVDIESAYHIIIRHPGKQDVKSSSLNIFYNQYVTSVSEMDNFLTFLNKLNNIDNEIYYKRLMTSKEFGDKLTIDNFFVSNEYKKILNKFKPTFSLSGSDSKVYFMVEYPSKTFHFSFTANCNYSHTDSREGGLGLLEYMFSSAEGATDYYKIEKCMPSKSDLSIISEFERKLVGKSNSYSQQWEVSTYSHRDVHYPTPTQRSMNTGNYAPCYSSDKCFKISRKISDNRYEIECTKGSHVGQKYEICGKKNGGKWASGCGMGDAFAFHYNSIDQAGKSACDW